VCLPADRFTTVEVRIGNVDPTTNVSQGLGRSNPSQGSAGCPHTCVVSTGLAAHTLLGAHDQMQDPKACTGLWTVATHWVDCCTTHPPVLPANQRQAGTAATNLKAPLPCGGSVDVMPVVAAVAYAVWQVLQQHWCLCPWTSAHTLSRPAAGRKVSEHPELVDDGETCPLLGLTCIPKWTPHTGRTKVKQVGTALSYITCRLQLACK
jgi:hypothetical protein